MKKLKLIKFSAPWCGPCRAFASSYSAIFEKYKEDVEFIVVNIDEDDDAYCSLYNVSAIPTIIIADYSGKELKRISPPLDKASIEAILDNLLNNENK